MSELPSVQRFSFQAIIVAEKRDHPPISAFLIQKFFDDHGVKCAVPNFMSKDPFVLTIDLRGDSQ